MRVLASAPAASAVIYGGTLMLPASLSTGVADALAVPESDLRLFGKPESFTSNVAWA